MENFKKCPECLQTERVDAKYCSECSHKFGSFKEDGKPMNPTIFSVFLRFLTVSTVLRIIAAGLLLNSILPQNYAYFYFLKLFVCFVGAYLIYVSIMTRNFAWIVVYLFAVILFNPFSEFPITRNMWQTIDITAALVFLVSIFLLRENIKK